MAGVDTALCVCGILINKIKRTFIVFFFFCFCYMNMREREFSGERDYLSQNILSLSRRISSIMDRISILRWKPSCRIVVCGVTDASIGMVGKGEATDPVLL